MTVFGVVVLLFLTALMAYGFGDGARRLKVWRIAHDRSDARWGKAELEIISEGRGAFRRVIQHDLFLGLLGLGLIVTGFWRGWW
ncbi:MAG: hypothetical protein Q8R13_02905 [bacterium]|nr:hypothetical protein [bacterium]